MNKPDLTVSDYLKWVNESHYVEGLFEKDTMYQDHVYFRGQASVSWELLPSLFRDSERIHDENMMLEMANNMLWTELNDCRSDLEKMIRLQHYGLHTRLLDITYNPLVALFFACQTPSKPDDDKDGVVYCGYKEGANTKTSYTIAEYVFNHNVFDINQTAFENICKKNNVTQKDCGTIHLITPPLNNPRISAQNGAFIMSPLIKKDVDSHFYIATQADIKKELKTAFMKRYIIPENSKSSIIEELDYLGFNKATIFVDITQKLQYINEKEDKETMWKIDLNG